MKTAAELAVSVLLGAESHKRRSTQIKRVAGGDKTALDEATAVYRRHIRQHLQNGRKSPEINFIEPRKETCDFSRGLFTSEVLQPVPDLALRAMYREHVLGRR